MKKRFLFIGALVVFMMLVANLAFVTAGPAADCDSVASSDMPNLSSQGINFNCAAALPVYFGVCDSGAEPMDDLFQIEFGGGIVTNNFFVDTNEYFVLGTAQSSAGVNSATLRSVNNSPVTPATFSYAISSDSGVVVDYLSQYCGADFQGPGLPTGAGCLRNVPVFTTDKAPTSGTLEFRIMLGNEDSREDSILLKTWSITAGQQLNNALVTNVHGTRYARVYWHPDGGEWSMLTSQYFHNEGTKNDEYGIDCRYAAQPSYHTSFASALPLEDVCFDLLNGCR